MQNIKYINFPKTEHDDYLKRLNEKQIIYTTRVSKEAGRYSINEIYDSPFGRLKIISLEHFKKLEEHPFLNELNETQMLELNNYINEKGYDLIGLIKLW